MPTSLQLSRSMREPSRRDSEYCAAAVGWTAFFVAAVLSHSVETTGSVYGQPSYGKRSVGPVREAVDNRLSAVSTYLEDGSTAASVTEL